MASNDSFVVSFWTKYHYVLWRPETAIFEGNFDGNAKTAGDVTFKPYILTPCFPSYPSNHGSASNSAAEILRRVYGADGHDIIMANAAVPGVTFHYTRFNQITDDISDARIYGGIHFRFDQEAGAELGRELGRTCTSTISDARRIRTTTTKATIDEEHDSRSRHRDWGYGSRTSAGRVHWGPAPFNRRSRICTDDEGNRVPNAHITSRLELKVARDPFNPTHL